MASKIRLTQAKVGKSTGTGGVKVSAKALKDKASDNAYEASPTRYLGLKKGQGGNLRLSHLVANGLSPKSAEFLAENLNLPASEFTIHYVQVPKQTMARRKALGKLNVAESDRVARFARLLKQATDMMEGNQNAAIGWLKSPQVLLENQAPLEYARTESGAAEVQQLIGRIESGVYS
jgi:putative toxin-antitoxin system antitoxin component (TIGR02293 family)